MLKCNHQPTTDNLSSTVRKLYFKMSTVERKPPLKAPHRLKSFILWNKTILSFLITAQITSLLCARINWAFDWLICTIHSPVGCTLMWVCFFALYIGKCFSGVSKTDLENADHRPHTSKTQTSETQTSETQTFNTDPENGQNFVCVLIEKVHSFIKKIIRG